MPSGRHPGLVEEDAAEMVPVGEDLVLKREESAARIHEIDAGKAALAGDFLGAEVLLHRQGIVRAPLHGGVVRNDHGLAPPDPPDPRHDPGGGNGILVHLVRRQRGQFEKGAARIDQRAHPVADAHLAAPLVLLYRRGGAPFAASASRWRRSSTSAR